MYFAFLFCYLWENEKKTRKKKRIVNFLSTINMRQLNSGTSKRKKEKKKETKKTTIMNTEKYIQFWQ